jgi:uncharacterized YigZ family protein
MIVLIELNYYTTIEQPGVAEFKDRNSKFLAYALPVNTIDEFKKELQRLKELHPKANHFCFAYRIGADGMVFRVSDDGEPSGSAGRPILSQIDSKQLINIAVVVVRYFGGTLLGVPGLINAYKTSTALVLQTVPTTQKQIEVNYRVDFDYTRMNDVMLILKQCNCAILEQQLQLFSSIKTGVPKNRLEEVLYRFKELHDVQLQKVS